jgi:hypothetical protein
MIFSSRPGLIFHEKSADRASAHHRTGSNRAGVSDKNVARIAVGGERVWNEPIVAGIAHGRTEKPVDHEDTGGLVEFLLDGLAANWYLNDDVDVVLWICPHGNRF